MPHHFCCSDIQPDAVQKMAERPQKLLRIFAHAVLGPGAEVQLEKNKINLEDHHLPCLLGVGHYNLVTGLIVLCKSMGLM